MNNERETLLAVAEPEEWQDWITGLMLKDIRKVLWGDDCLICHAFYSCAQYGGPCRGGVLRFSRSKLILAGYDRLKRAGIV